MNETDCLFCGEDSLPRHRSIHLTVRGEKQNHRQSKHPQQNPQLQSTTLINIQNSKQSIEFEYGRCFLFLPK